MENSYFAVIPAQAGIPWLQELRDPCLRRDDGKLVFFDTLQRGEGIAQYRDDRSLSKRRHGGLKHA